MLPAAPSASSPSAFPGSSRHAAGAARACRRSSPQSASPSAVSPAPGWLVELGLALSPDTLLRSVRALPEVTIPTPRVIGVDDWAYRKGHRYGTILVDLERHEAIGLLPDRNGDTVATWLAAHPGIQIISRDRGLVYAD